jgi:hypothetical protein
MTMGGSKSFASDTGGLLVDVTAEGFAGPYTYQVLDAADGSALSGWLDENGFVMGETEDSLDLYIEEGGYSFIAVTLTPDEAPTAEGGRTLPPLSIQSDSDRLHFPARMAQSGGAEELYTIVYVLGEYTADVEGWASTDPFNIRSETDDAAGTYEDYLLELALSEPSYVARPYSGAYGDRWLTRFDTIAPPSHYSVDPVFGFMDAQYTIETMIIVPEEEGDTAAWLLLPIIGLGFSRRRQ